MEPAGHGVDGRAETGGRCGGSGVCLEVPGRGGGVDRTPLPAGQEQGGLRRGGVCGVAGTQGVGAEERTWHGREYTIFVDSTSAITRVRDDARGPGQRFGVAAIEVETRLAAAGNRLTIRWVPAHAGAEGNEVADQYAKDAATGRAPRERLPGGYAEETSLAHMTRVATEARSRATTEWITDHVRPGRRYRPPPGKGVRRTS